MSISKLHIPATRKEKIEFLQGLMKGEKSLEDLGDPTFKITLWRDDPSIGGNMQTFLDGPAGIETGTSITKAKYEAIINKATFNVTLDLTSG